MAYILLIIGFVLLIKGADFFVEGSSNVAKKLKVPSIIIGLTIVALGTSLPELVTSFCDRSDFADRNEHTGSGVCMERRKQKIVRWHGCVMLAIYAGYLYYIIQR